MDEDDLEVLLTILLDKAEIRLSRPNSWRMLLLLMMMIVTKFRTT